MNLGLHPSAGRRAASCGVARRGVGVASARASVEGWPVRGIRAFSLFEMVIVVGLVGLLAALALPSMKLGKGNQMAAATRQLLDDLSLARLRAINNRSQVYVVFLPQATNTFVSPTAPVYDFFTTNQAANHLLGSQRAAYAIFAKRMLGDQPGRATSRYMSEWKTLPEGVFIGRSTVALDSFFNPAVFCNVVNNTPRPYELIQFPDTTPGNPSLLLPYIGFNEKGGLLGFTADVRIPLAMGSLMAARTNNGADFMVADIDSLETPANNSVNNYNRIVISYQTGRARVERPELP